MSEGAKRGAEEVGADFVFQVEGKAEWVWEGNQESTPTTPLCSSTAGVPSHANDTCSWSRGRWSGRVKP
jgi:hypothetical protein